MKKIIYIFKEMIFMIKQHKLFFLAPILIVIVMLALFVYYITPTVMSVFIYAGF